MSLFNILVLGGFLLSSAVCIYSYRFRISRNRVYIPSSFLITKFPSNKKSGSPHFPPRLLIELLSLAAIFLTLHYLNRENSKDKHLIIIDTSLSMSAKNSSGTAVLDRAKEAAIASINQNEIFQFSEIPNFSPTDTSLDITVDILKEKISKAKTSSLPDSIATSINETIEKSDSRIVTIYTDKELVIGENKSKKRINVKNLGSQEQNAYISDLSENNKLDGVLELEVGVGFSGSVSSNVSVSLIEVDNNKTISSKNITIFSNRPNTVTYNIPNNASSRYIVKLDKFLHSDAIDSDNHAYWTKSIIKPKTVELISSTTHREAISGSLSRATNFKIDFIDESEYQARLTPNEAVFAVFYKTKLPEEFKSNSLVVLPTAEQQYLRIQNPQGKLELTSWEQSSSLTKYINFKAFNVNQSLVFPNNSWSSPILTSNQGNILIFGIRDSKEVIVSGFELFPLDTIRRDSSDIILLNLLAELAKDSKSNPLDYKFSQVDSDLKCLLGETGCDLEAQPLKKGIYKRTEQNEDQLFFVNNINSEESDTFNKRTEIINLPATQENLIKIESTNDIPNVIYFALALLIIDLILVITFQSEINWKGSK